MHYANFAIAIAMLTGPSGAEAQIAPPITLPPTALPSAAQPASVAIVARGGQAPVKLERAGKKVYYALKLTGEIAAIKWSILPPDTEGFDSAADGKTADFATPDAGVYVFVVSVAAKDGTVDHAFHRLELTATGAPSAAPAAAKASSVADLIRGYALEVKSHNLAAEAAALAVLMQGIGETSQMPDMVRECREQTVRVLGLKAGPWMPFFEQLAVLFRDMQKRGAMIGHEGQSKAIQQTAEILEQLGRVRPNQP